MNRDYQGQIKFVLFILILVIFIILGNRYQINPEYIQDKLYRFPGLVMAAIFIAAYVLVTFFIWFSKDVFRLVAAFIFGAGLSTLLVWVAETINACLLFYFSRFMGGQFIQESISKERLLNWQQRMERHSGFFSLLLLRAVPLVPFRFFDLFMGLSGISFRKFAVIVILGSPLRIFWLQYILAAIGRNIFQGPAALINYLLEEKLLFMVSLVYLILALFLGYKLGGRK